MKVNLWWLLLAAAYSFLLGVAVSHDWQWMEPGYTSPSSFMDRWFVNTAQVASIGVPFIVYACVLFNGFLQEIAGMVRHETDHSAEDIRR
jgi:hypothetical protein